MSNQNSVLVISSAYYATLAKKHLQQCEQFLQHSGLTYDIEHVKAGAYELPAVLLQFEKHRPYRGYLLLGLVLEGSTDHYQFIWQHLKECFIQYTLQGKFFGNAIVTASTHALLTERVEQGHRAKEAVEALNYLLNLNAKIKL